MIFYPAMSTITTWFFKKRGLAFGVIAAGSSLGGVILPIMASSLLNDMEVRSAVLMSARYNV